MQKIIEIKFKNIFNFFSIYFDLTFKIIFRGFKLVFEYLVLQKN